jgi:hypothetical protein
MTVAELIADLQKRPPNSVVGQWRYVGGRMKFQEVNATDVEVIQGDVYVGIELGQFTVAVDLKDWAL